MNNRVLNHIKLIPLNNLLYHYAYLFFILRIKVYIYYKIIREDLIPIRITLKSSLVEVKIYFFNQQDRPDNDTD